MFALFMAVVVVAVYAGRFWRHDFADMPGAWGEFGDYVGGVINPIVGLVISLKQRPRSSEMPSTIG
jgi:hypothetical protein